MTEAHPRWPTRAVPADLTDRYLDEGWWDDRTLGALVDAWSADMSTVPFSVHSGVRPWRGTVGDVVGGARAFAAWLAGRGIGPGAVVVIQLPNWCEAAIAFWGATLAGAVVVPVVHFYGARELTHILRSTTPALLVTAERFGRTDYVASLRDVVAEVGVPWAVVAGPGADLPPGTVRFDDALEAAPLASPVAVDPDAPAIVAFTSGTTSDPKGVVHSHRTLGFETRQSATISPVTTRPPLTVAPVGHFIGMLSAFLGSLARRVPINLVDVWDPGRVLRLMEDEDVALTGGAPYFFTSLLEHPAFTPEHLAHLPAAGLGGAPVPPSFTRRLADLGIEVMRCYGSTEHPTISGCRFEEPTGKRMSTDGHALPGVEIRLDGDGQILSRGPDLCLGYTDPALTATHFDDDGWYRTGDVGELDDDGFLTITDRVSDIIIRGGENISAQEVEDLLLGVPGVAEVAVVAAPDERFGERAVAVIRTADGARRPTLEDLQARLRAVGLAKQKWPESVSHVTDLPRTPSGKVQKFRLRELLRDEPK